MTSAPQFPPPATEPQPGPRTPLLRSGTDTMLGGVCGGLADYTGIDTVLWRVGFVVLTLFGGSGVLVYALLWVLMPPAADRRPNALDGLVAKARDALTGNRR